MGYYDCWPGFNVPGVIVQAVLNDKDNLLRKEIALGQVLEHALDLHQFYVIATAGDAVSLPHEFAHGLYEMVPDYRMDVDEVLDTISPRLMEKMKLYLMDHQYANVER